jgi:protease I
VRVLFPLPRRDFDPTESAVPWRALLDAGHAVIFATPDGRPASADPRILTGRGFGPWRPFLRAGRHARALYAEMEASAPFRNPRRYDDLTPHDYDAVMLTGGHAPGMKEYLESKRVHDLVANHMRADKPLAAICHGVLVAARARDAATGLSSLHGRRTTALTKAQELSAYAMTGLWLGSYYRTYPLTVQDEVTRALASPDDFEMGPFLIGREGPARRDYGFTLRDGNYLSARYYGDAYKLADDFVAMLTPPEAAHESTESTRK